MDNKLGSENNGNSKCLTCSSLDTKVINVVIILHFKLMKRVIYYYWLFIF